MTPARPSGAASGPATNDAMMSAGYVALGGALGALARYAVVSLLAGASWPWGTLAVNVLGSLLIGVVVGAWHAEAWFVDVGRPLLVVGLLGGFTTFSTFSLDALLLLQAGRFGAAAAYVLASVSSCLFGAWLGFRVAAAA